MSHAWWFVTGYLVGGLVAAIVAELLHATMWKR